MNDADARSSGPEFQGHELPILTSRWTVGLQVFLSVLLILAMEIKAVHRFLIHSGPASETGLFDLFITTSYLLVLVVMIGTIFFTIKRFHSTLTCGSTLFRAIIFQGLLLLNLALLGMDTMRF